MTISTRVREIVADLSGAMIETVSAETSIEGLFGAGWTSEGIWPPWVAICDKLEMEYETTIPWTTARTWATVGDVVRYVEAHG